MITLLKKKNQYDSMFKKPEAISRAPICNGISKLEKVPLRPAVNTKKTMMVPWMVTKARYMLGSITPSGAHLPKKYSKMAVTKNAQMVKGKRVMDMPLVRKFKTVTM